MSALFKIATISVEAIGVAIFLAVIWKGNDPWVQIAFLGGVMFAGPVMFIEGRMSLRKELTGVDRP